MDAKAGAHERFYHARDDLIALSHRIHANPEIGLKKNRLLSGFRKRCWTRASVWKQASVIFRLRLSPGPGVGRCILASARNMTACQGSAMPVGIILLPPHRLGPGLPRQDCG